MARSGAVGTGGSFLPSKSVVSTLNPSWRGDNRIPLSLSPFLVISIQEVTNWVFRGFLFSSDFLTILFDRLNNEYPVSCKKNIRNRQYAAASPKDISIEVAIFLS